MINLVVWAGIINKIQMKKIVQLVLVLILASGTAFGQEKVDFKKHPFYADIIAGPYLMVDHHLYKSVFLKGPRVGYHVNSKFSLGIEYLVGQQHDITGELGTTHAANGQVFYYLKDRSLPSKFYPYLLIGGGFMEFKDFSEDVYGLAFYGGAGFSCPFSYRIQGFAESRYVNLGPLNLAGQNELGVLWGLRVNF